MALPIETERLILREYKESDWEDTHEYAGDEEVVKFMPWGPNTEQQTKEFIRQVIRAQSADPRLLWEFAIELKEEKKVIGGCGLQLSNAEWRYGNSRSSAEMGYVINRAYWGKGFVTEISRALLTFGFEKLDLHRIWGTCDPENVGSYRVLRKLGMKMEGQWRQSMLVKDKWHDCFLYAMLKDDWQK